MYYNNLNISEISLNKYERLITIGCSFTRYRWATWADVLAQDMHDAKFINLGKCGAGNSYIQTILSQAKRKLSLTDKDLVGICWSTFYREDKFIKGIWRTPGNIFNIGYDTFSEDYYKNHVDIEGMTMRDCAIIDTVTQSLKQEKFDSFGLMGVGLNGQSYYAGLPPEETFALQTLYNDLDTIQPCLWTYNECQWPVHYTYKSTHDGKDFLDYHPSSPVYRNWLKHIGFPMGEDSKNYAEFCDDIMKQTTLQEVFEDPQWPWHEEASPLEIDQPWNI